MRKEKNRKGQERKAKRLRTGEQRGGEGRMVGMKNGRKKRNEGKEGMNFIVW